MALPTTLTTIRTAGRARAAATGRRAGAGARPPRSGPSCPRRTGPKRRLRPGVRPDHCPAARAL